MAILTPGHVNLVSAKNRETQKVDLNVTIKDLLIKAGTKELTDEGRLINLIKESKITFAEIKKVLGKDINKESIFRLWMFALLRSIRNKSQMSSRYNDFLDKTIDLLLNNKIKFKMITHYDFSRDFADKQFSFVGKYVERDNAILFFPPAKDQLSVDNFERDFIHELFHAYQDFKKKAITSDRAEAEAYLAQSDLMMHRYSHYMNDSWIIFKQAGKGGFLTFDLSPPKRYTEIVVGNNDNDPECRKVLAAIEHDYMAIRIFFAFFNSPDFIRAAANYSKKIDEQFVKRGEAINSRKLFESAFSRLKESRNEKITLIGNRLVFSPELIRDLLIIKACINFAEYHFKLTGDIDWKKDAQDYLRKYYELFLIKVDISALEKTDNIINFDGIR